MTALRGGFQAAARSLVTEEAVVRRLRRRRSPAFGVYFGAVFGVASQGREQGHGILTPSEDRD